MVFSRIASCPSDHHKYWQSRVSMKIDTLDCSCCSQSDLIVSSRCALTLLCWVSSICLAEKRFTVSRIPLVLSFRCQHTHVVTVGCRKDVMEVPQYDFCASTHRKVIVC